MKSTGNKCIDETQEPPESRTNKKEKVKRMKGNIQRDWWQGSDLRGWCLRWQESKCLGYHCSLTQMGQRLASFLKLWANCSCLDIPPRKKLCQGHGRTHTLLPKSIALVSNGANENSLSPTSSLYCNNLKSFRINARASSQPLQIIKTSRTIGRQFIYIHWQAY